MNPFMDATVMLGHVLEFVTAERQGMRADTARPKQSSECDCGE